MSDDQSVLAELGIDVDDFDAPDHAWSSALEATFDPATPAVAGDVVPTMDDEPRLSDEIDLGDNDASGFDAGEANSHRDAERDPDSDDDIDVTDSAGAAAGAMRVDEDAPPDLGADSEDDDPFSFDL